MMKKIELNKIIIITGNYGSGKTEVSVNLAAYQKMRGVDVCIVDLDLVNPYFRTREAKAALNDIGVEVVLPADQYLNADLPILSPDVGRAIRRNKDLTIIDAGGEQAGVMAVAALADYLKGRDDVRMIQVVNPLRPFTDTIEGSLKIRQKIESAAKLKIDGVICNSNLIDETSAEDIYKGYETVFSYCKKTDTRLEFVTVESGIFDYIDQSRFECPILTIKRQLVPPWKKAEKLS